MRSFDDGGGKPAVAPRANAGGDDGDRFEELYHRWYGSVVALCRRCLGTDRDAEAIAQEAFVRAWASLDRFSPERPFWPWISTIARRLCFNERVADTRREGRLARSGAMALSDSSSSEQEALDRWPGSGGVGQAMGLLSARHRRMLFLHHVEGWTYADIARLDGTSVEAVRGSLKRARAELRRLYGGRLVDRLVGVPIVVRRGLDALRRGVERRGAVVASWFTAPEAVAWMAALLLAPAWPAATAPSRPQAVAEPVLAAAPVAATNPPGLPSRTPSAYPRPSAMTTDDAGTSSTADDFDVGDGWGYTFTASPSYDTDHTVFASGATRCDSGEAPKACPLLLRSDDGARTWRRLPATGILAVVSGGRVLLPPEFPRDPRVFVAGPTVLMASDDGGVSFGRAIPVSNMPVISPRSSDGAVRFLMTVSSWNGFNTGVEYNDDTRSLQPLALPLPVGDVPIAFAFGPDYARDGTILVSAVRHLDLALSADPTSSAIYACTPRACEEAMAPTRFANITAFVGSPKHQTVYAWTMISDTFFRSRDGGRSFTSLEFPDSPASAPLRLVQQEDGRLLALMHRPHFGDFELLVSDDDGDSWTSTFEHRWLNELTALPDGTLLATGRDGDPGLLCSVDEGHTWTQGCPP